MHPVLQVIDLLISFPDLEFSQILSQLEGSDPGEEFVIAGECCQDMANGIVRNLVGVCVARLRKYDEDLRNNIKREPYSIFSKELSDQKSTRHIGRWLHLDSN